MRIKSCLKRTQLLCILLFLTIGGHAQEKNKALLKGGLAISGLSDVSYSSKTGYHAGFYLHFNLPDNFRIETGTCFTTIGLSLADAFALQIPVLLEYPIRLDKNLSVVPSAGVYGGAIWGDIEIGYVGGSGVSMVRKDNNLDYGFSLGLAFEFKRFVLEFRGDLGEKEFFIYESNFHGLNEEKGKNRTFKLSLGYFL